MLRISKKIVLLVALLIPALIMTAASVFYYTVATPKSTSTIAEPITVTTTTPLTAMYPGQTGYYVLTITSRAASVRYGMNYTIIVTPGCGGTTMIKNCTSSSTVSTTSWTPYTNMSKIDICGGGTQVLNVTVSVPYSISVGTTVSASVDVARGAP